MKVSQMVALGKIGFTEKPIPTPREDEALVRLEYVGICGSDLHYFTEGRIGDKVVEYPFTLGHEPAGTVVAVGEKVQGLAVGDRVAASGRMQSRVYRKVLEDGRAEDRVAYEVSLSRIEKLP